VNGQNATLHVAVELKIVRNYAMWKENAQKKGKEKLNCEIAR